MQFANWFSIPTNRMVVLIDGPPQQIGWLYNYNYFKRLEFYFHFFDSGGSATRWCQHKYLANLPGHTMALALKYRLLCGSVVVSSPLMYHEWYYSSWLVVLGFTWFYMVLHGFAGCSAYILYFPCGWDDPQISHFLSAVFQHQVSWRTKSTSFRWISPGPLQRMSWQHFGATQGWRKASEQERGGGQKVTWRRPWRAWLKAGVTIFDPFIIMMP